MNSSDLSPEEREILTRFRQLNDSQRKAVKASKNSFIEWLKSSVAWVWDKISGFASDVWNFFTSFF